MKHTIVTTETNTFCCLCGKNNVNADEDCQFLSLTERSEQGPMGKKHAFTEASMPLCHYCGCDGLALTTDCARRLLTQDEQAKVRAFVLDYFNGQWREL